MTPTADRTAASRNRFRLSWADPRARALGWQIVVVALLSGAIAMLVLQTAMNLKLRGIVSGFAYLDRAAGFEISHGLLPYSSRDTYGWALAIGLLNTLRVTALGAVLATVLGVVIGLARLSRIWVVSALSRAYVEALRNTPLLLQLLFWYSLSQTLPPPRDAWQPCAGVFLCFRGLFLPGLAWHHGFPWLEIERTSLVGFDFRGGFSISPEFAALLIGLSTYTSAFIGEIVRGGIQSVGRGQTEAAAALGLTRGHIRRLVVLPQALRAIVPPTTTQFTNLAKNSSLAVAIGYPDLMSISNTTLNQTGQAVEAIAVATAVYLVLCLVISLAMNLYSHRATLSPVRAGGVRAT